MSREMSYALRVIGNDHKSSVGDLYESAVHIIGYLFGTYQSEREGKDLIPLKYKHEIECGLHLIKKLLGLGLDPNARIKSIDDRIFIQVPWDYLRSGQRTPWKVYLECLDGFCAQAGASERLDSLCRQALDLIKHFPERGADCNVLLETRVDYSFEPRMHKMYGVDFWLENGETTFKKSALQIIDECCSKLGYPSAVLTVRLQAGGATKVAVVNKIQRQEYRDKLLIFTVDQNRKLLCLLRSYQESSLSIKNDGDPSNGQLLAAIHEVFQVNKEHILKSIRRRAA
ncbi:MAG: hypothetical protein M1822_004082 [Bathelium mastoideum]|nr:MAG: hypothetical protein M1822_004082 [Bathelium mastoideum]